METIEIQSDIRTINHQNYSFANAFLCFEVWAWMGVAESKSEGAEISELTFGCFVTSFHFHFPLRTLQYTILCWMFLGPAIWKIVQQILDIFQLVLSTSWVLVSTMSWSAINCNSLKWKVMCCNTHCNMYHQNTPQHARCPSSWFKGIAHPSYKISVCVLIWVCRMSPIYRDISRLGERVRYMTSRLIGDIPTKECDL